MYTEQEYDEAMNNKKLIAKKIWDNLFFSGLQELNIAQLVIIINSLVEELDYLKNGKYERDWKDIAFDQKCLIVASLDDKFFKNRSKK